MLDWENGCDKGSRLAAGFYISSPEKVSFAKSHICMHEKFLPSKKMDSCLGLFARTADAVTNAAPVPEMKTGIAAQ